MGEWKRVELSYLKANRTACELCGQPLPGRYWQADVEGKVRIFCGPAHEEKYLTYWLPRYGQAKG